MTDAILFVLLVIPTFGVLFVVCDLCGLFSDNKECERERQRQIMLTNQLYEHQRRVWYEMAFTTPPAPSQKVNWKAEGF